MKTFETLPRDLNGIIQGAWRIVHNSASFEGSVGPVNFVKGRADRAMTGQPLARFMAGMGGSVRCEPWDPAVEEATPAPAPERRKPGFGPSGPPGSLPATEGNREQIQAEKEATESAAAIAAGKAWVEKNNDPRWAGAAPRASKPVELPAKSKKGRRKKVQSARASAPMRDDWDDIQDMAVLEAIASGMGIDVSKFKGADSLRHEMRRVQAEQ